MKLLTVTKSYGTDESGKLKTCTDYRIVEAQSIMDAEVATINHVGTSVGATVDAVKKYKVSEIFFSEHNPELPFWQVTVGIETFNEKTKKIKLTKTVVLAQANSVLDAATDVIAAFGKTSDFEILKVTKTPIMEIINPAA